MIIEKSLRKSIEIEQTRSIIKSIANHAKILIKLSSKGKKEKRSEKVFCRTEKVLNRKFQATKPLEKLVTDITHLPFGKKMMYLSSIVDLYNGEIIAYKISEKQDQQLVRPENT